MSARRSRWFVVVVIGTLIGIEILIYSAVLPAAGWLVLVAGVLLVGVARLAGLSFADLGLSADSVGRGLRYGAVIVAAVVLIAGIGLAIGPTRELFLNDRYQDLGPALKASLVIIPLRTVLGEELLFRGVLLGGLLQVFSTRVAVCVQALFFGLWHVASSLGLAASNAGLHAILGEGWVATVGGVTLAVLVTGAAGILLGWLRIRSGSLLAPIALHWAANGIGAVTAALAWQVSG